MSSTIRLFAAFIQVMSSVINNRMTQEPIETRRKKLLHRAKYRGFREADLLVGSFAEAHIDGFDEAELDEFEALLSIDDHDLYGWTTGTKPAPANISGPVFERLCAFDVAAVTAPRR